MVEDEDVTADVFATLGSLTEFVDSQASPDRCTRAGRGSLRKSAPAAAALFE